MIRIVEVKQIGPTVLELDLYEGRFFKEQVRLHTRETDTTQSLAKAVELFRQQGRAGLTPMWS
jgi:hypothetical protein